MLYSSTAAGGNKVVVTHVRPYMPCAHFIRSTRYCKPAHGTIKIEAMEPQTHALCKLTGRMAQDAMPSASEPLSGLFGDRNLDAASGSEVAPSIDSLGPEDPAGRLLPSFTSSRDNTVSFVSRLGVITTGGVWVSRFVCLARAGGGRSCGRGRRRCLR